MINNRGGVLNFWEVIFFIMLLFVLCEKMEGMYKFDSYFSEIVFENGRKSINSEFLFNFISDNMKTIWEIFKCKKIITCIIHI